MKEIIDVRFADDNAYSWNPVRMDKLFSGWEKLNKDKNGQACYDQRRHFYPFCPLSVLGGSQRAVGAHRVVMVYLSLAIRYVHL